MGVRMDMYVCMGVCMHVGMVGREVKETYYRGKRDLL